jgi:WD40 repeat protein
LFICDYIKAGKKSNQDDTMKKLFLCVLFMFNAISLYAAQPLEVSNWDLDAINASRIVLGIKNNEGSIKNNHYLSPVITKQHLTFLDHMTLKPFSEQIAGDLAGVPIYDPDGRYVFITTKDGWLRKYNLQTGELEIKVRVGLKTANSALSGNARFLLVGNQQPADLVFLNPDDLSVVQIIPVQNRKGILSPVTAVRNAGELHGFIVVPQNFPQIWKVSYLDPPPIGFGDGWNHDYRCLKDHMDKPLFPIKRLRIEQTLTDFYIDEKNIYLLGINTNGEGIIFDLDLSRIVSHLDVSSIAPDLIWETGDASELAVLNNENTSLSFYSNTSHLGKWKKEVDIDVDHVTAITVCPQSEMIWLGGESGKVQLINKNSHTVEQTLQFSQGRINQISCTQDSKYMLMEVGDDKKMLVVYDNLMRKVLINKI